jgi:6-pyruvoyltetrahydropterin/6-carboxytetrahydropterin synthase
LLSGEGIIVLRITHNIEIAHRLTFLPGKCQNIHGHSMVVDLSVFIDESDENGYALDAQGTILEFGNLKKAFRAYLDSIWDHHLHLNEKDPWALPVTLDGDLLECLPGLQTWPADPSTENIARWIRQACQLMIPDLQISISIEETKTNGVECYA